MLQLGTAGRSDKAEGILEDHPAKGPAPNGELVVNDVRFRPCIQSITRQFVGTSSATLPLPMAGLVCCIDQLNPPPIAGIGETAEPSIGSG